MAPSCPVMAPGGSWGATALPYGTVVAGGNVPLQNTTGQPGVGRADRTGRRGGLGGHEELHHQEGGCQPGIPPQSPVSAPIRPCGSLREQPTSPVPGCVHKPCSTKYVGKAWQLPRQLTPPGCALNNNLESGAVKKYLYFKKTTGA